MGLIKDIAYKIIRRFSIYGVDYRIEPSLDSIATQDSKKGVMSGGVYAALQAINTGLRSDVPVENSDAGFTAGGAYIDKTDGCLQGDTKNFISKGAYKYFTWLLGLLGAGTWTQGNGGNTNSFVTIICNGDKFVATGYTDDGIWYSANGKTWLRGSGYQANGYNQTLAYANGIWVAGSGGGSRIWWSTDAQNWNQGTGLASSLDIRCVVYFGVWVLGTTQGLYYSSDGKAWSKSTSAFFEAMAITFGNGLYVAGTRDGNFFWSTDLYAWTAGTGDIGSNVVFDIAFGNGMFVASTAKGLLWSSNGKNWSIGYESMYSAIIGRPRVLFTGNVWLAAGAVGNRINILRSIDGKNWVSVCTNVGLLSNIVSNGSYCVAGGSTGIYVSENEGLTWSLALSVSAAGACYGKGLFVVGTLQTGIYWSAFGLLPASLPD